LFLFSDFARKRAPSRGGVEGKKMKEATWCIYRSKINLFFFVFCVGICTRCPLRGASPTDSSTDCLFLN
jgi:hypothetical protein